MFNRKEVIHIKINFVTGVVTAKGPSLKTWIQSDFEHIEKVIRKKTISETSTLDNKSEETDKHEEKNLKDLIKSNDNGIFLDHRVQILS